MLVLFIFIVIFFFCTRILGHTATHTSLFTYTWVIFFFLSSSIYTRNISSSSSPLHDTLSYNTQTLVSHRHHLEITCRIIIIIIIIIIITPSFVSLSSPSPSHSFLFLLPVVLYHTRISHLFLFVYRNEKKETGALLLLENLLIMRASYEFWENDRVVVLKLVHEGGWLKMVISQSSPSFVFWYLRSKRQAAPDTFRSSVHPANEVVPHLQHRQCTILSLKNSKLSIIIIYIILPNYFESKIKIIIDCANATSI